MLRAVSLPGLSTPGRDPLPLWLLSPSTPPETIRAFPAAGRVSYVVESGTEDVSLTAVVLEFVQKTPGIRPATIYILRDHRGYTGAVRSPQVSQTHCSSGLWSGHGAVLAGGPFVSSPNRP